MTSVWQPFHYSAEERSAILETWPDDARADWLRDFHLGQMEKDADHFLFMTAEGKALPDRDYLAKRRIEKLGQLRATRSMLIRDKHLSQWIDDNRAEIWKRGESPTAVLCKMFLDDRLSSVTFESEIAVIAIDFLINMHSKDSFEEHVKGSGARDRTHRDDYLSVLIQRWAELNAIKVNQCSISDDGPMMRFLEAATGPVLSVTGGPIGPKMIRNIVRKAIVEIAADSDDLEMNAAE